MSNLQEARDARSERRVYVNEVVGDMYDPHRIRLVHMDMIWYTLEDINENLARIADVLERGADK
jgi:hypothetical protein